MKCSNRSRFHGLQTICRPFYFYLATAGRTMEAAPQMAAEGTRRKNHGVSSTDGSRGHQKEEPWRQLHRWKQMAPEGRTMEAAPQMAEEGTRRKNHGGSSTDGSRGHQQEEPWRQLHGWQQRYIIGIMPYHRY